MFRYTVICCDTGNYEGPDNPEHVSTRVYWLAEESAARAAGWAKEFLIDEFGADRAVDWHVIGVLLGDVEVETWRGEDMTIIQRPGKETR